jgi:spore germination protein
MRFFLIFAALFLGLYGFVLAFLVMLSHLASLRSFGVPYLQLKIPLRLPKQTDSANEG